jgi:hypothetical protein
MAEEARLRGTQLDGAAAKAHGCSLTTDVDRRMLIGRGKPAPS